MPATDADYLEISEAYGEAKREIQHLFRVGTNRAQVNALLRQATRNLERGEYDRARRNIADARSTARNSTRNFIDNFITECRNILLAVRTRGANISTSRPLLITAKKALDRGEYGKAVAMCLDSIDTIIGLDDEFMSTLKVLAKVRYKHTLVESFGVDMSRAEGPLDQAFSELKAGNYRNAMDQAARARAEIKVLRAGYQETMKLRTDATFALEDARLSGVDVAKAQSLLERGQEKLERNEFQTAQELLRDAISSVELVETAVGRGDDRAAFVKERQRTANDVIARTKGMGADVSDAVLLFAMGNKRQQDAEWDQALAYYSEAIDEAIKAGKSIAWKGGGGQ